MPQAVREMVHEYRREMDVISAFIEDRCEVGDYLSVQASRLYSAYAAWCDDNNEYKMSNTKFSIEVAKSFVKKRLPEGMYFIGINLLR